MRISPENINNAIMLWLKTPGVTQFLATRLITRAYLAEGRAPKLALGRIELDGGVIDYNVWRSNRVNIFQRWRKCETEEQREKMIVLGPAIFAAIKASNAELHKQLTDGSSIEYLVSRCLKEHAEAVSAALNGAALSVLEQECDEVIDVLVAIKRNYRQLEMQKRC